MASFDKKKKDAAPKGELTTADKRALAARGNPLKARWSVGRQGLTGAVMATLRDAFVNNDLVKVRVDADSAAETQAIADEITQHIDCQLVRRLGRILLLYKPQTNETHKRP